MKITVPQAALAGVVGYARRSLPSRPPIPILAGLVLDAADGRLRVSGFDYEVSTDTAIPATVTEKGRVLISGRLLSDIVSTVRGDVLLELNGSRVILTAGRAQFTLPTLPVEDYPALPTPGAPSGTLDGLTFAQGLTRVACAVSHDDELLPVLTGIGLNHNSKTGALTLVATDRYRFAVCDLEWKTGDLPDCTSVVPSKPLIDAAKAANGDTPIDLVLPTAPGADGLFSLRSAHNTTTIRGLEGDLPKYKNLFPTEFSHTATVEIAPLAAAVQRVALVSSGKSDPIRLTFTADGPLVLEAGSNENAQAVDNVDTTLEGGAISIAFNPTYLLDGLKALTSETVDLQFTGPTKPALMRGHGTDDQALRYLLMPIRLSR
ncbi:DNA polymerase III subunit beta [Streptomyces sp. NPDC002758]